LQQEVFSPNLFDALTHERRRRAHLRAGLRGRLLGYHNMRVRDGQGRNEDGKPRHAREVQHALQTEPPLDPPLDV
jgi:hypothetical protein